MPSFDSIIIGEDWISEHYFATDSVKESFQGRVLKLRKYWDAEAKEGRSTVQKEFTGRAGDLQVVLASLAESPEGVEAANRLVRDSLGYQTDLTDFTAERSGVELTVPNSRQPGLDTVLVLQASAVNSIEDLLDPETGQMLEPALEDNKPLSPVSKVVSAIFRSDTPPGFVLVQAGQWVLLAEAERWAEGRYLAVDLLVVSERRHEAKGGEVDRAIAILGHQAFAPNADGSIWWKSALEDSVKHTVGVSKDLREGIRLSIEIIANDVVSRRAVRDLPLTGINGQVLARQSLRFLYRILFLLYAEASPEMRVLPSGAPEYETGYGLDRLRELTVTELVSTQAREGTHLYLSLAKLFELVDKGHAPHADDGSDNPAPGLHFNSLRADLFSPAATALIDQVGLSNDALQRVLEHLLLSKESKGREGADRGFISYAELGINQLGAVYEGLMAYTGFFAETDLYEVAKGGDAEGGSWVVPVDRADHLSETDFVRDTDHDTGETRPVIHSKGSFVFRLAGRERQQSASYYTPEVLTKFVVSQSLAELLDQDGGRTTPEQILELAICEPALGSGAFAIEAVRQLAAEYLKRKQQDLGKLIDPDQYPVELQKVKAHIALHQVYGVDLNGTAVELAEISLWLDTMVAGLQAPWFGLHLRRGNSLIGARRAIYSSGNLTKKSWLTAAPREVPLGTDVGEGVHHFLLPAHGWGAVGDTAEAKTYAPEGWEAIRAWRNEIRTNPSNAMKKRLVGLAQRVEILWELTLRRLTIAEAEIRRTQTLWGSLHIEREPVVSREQIEKVLHDENGSYQRLRRVMDAWCALWSWPVTTTVAPPDWDDWVGGLEAILGVHRKLDLRERYGQLNAFSTLDWFELEDAEANDFLFAGTQVINECRDQFAWLAVAEKIAKSDGFFHWELDFAPVFHRGGFDLQVGNPPWVRPAWSESIELGEFDAWWQLSVNSPETEKSTKRTAVLTESSSLRLFLNRRASQAGSQAQIGSPIDHPLLAETTPNLYRSFIERAWRSQKVQGVVGLLHPLNHFIDDSFLGLRRECYHRVRRHWEFKNQKKLFKEIGNTRPYCVDIYSDRLPAIKLMQASWIFHPDTVDRSLVHDGEGDQPGIKNAANDWDLSPHAGRIIHVNEDTLGAWLEIANAPAGTSPYDAQVVSAPNIDLLRILANICSGRRMPENHFVSSSGWSETTFKKKGFYTWTSSIPDSWPEVIFQSPQLGVANALYQQPNRTAKSHRDYSRINLEDIPQDFVPRTNYRMAKIRSDFIGAYKRWGESSSSEYTRIAWSEMSDPFTARSLQSCLLPAGPTHVHTINTCAILDSGTSMTVTMLATSHSIIADSMVKLLGAEHINPSFWLKLPYIESEAARRLLALRALRLNCVTLDYATVWSDSFDNEWLTDAWCPAIGLDRPDRPPLSKVSQAWDWNTPIRRDSDRRQALIEIDAIVAVALHVSVDDLIGLYQAMFPVLRQDDEVSLFDSQGRQLPSKLASELQKRKGIREDDLNFDGIIFHGPFERVDRVRDLKLAHEHFSGLVS